MIDLAFEVMYLAQMLKLYVWGWHEVERFGFANLRTQTQEPGVVASRMGEMGWEGKNRDFWRVGGTLTERRVLLYE